MINKLIYLPIEIKKREFDSRCYQAIKFLNKGYHVAICTKSAINYYNNKMKKGIIYFKSLGPRYHDLLHRLKKNGHKCILLDEEGISLINDKLYLERFYRKNIKFIDLFFAWGNLDLKTIKTIIRDKKIFKVGSPRVDLLIKKTNLKYFVEAKKLKRKHKNFILLNTFLNFVNHFSHKSPNQYLKDIKESGYSRESIRVSKLQVKMQNKIFKDYKKFLTIFATKFPKKKLIVRPHPGENHEVWKKLVSNHKNIKLIYDEFSACSWMLASEYSISSNCTTAIESFLLKKFNINYRPSKIPEAEFKLPRYCGYNIENLYKLEQFIKKNKVPKSTNYVTKEKNKLIKNIIENVNTNCSVEKMIRYLDENLKFTTGNGLSKPIVDLSIFENFKNILRVYSNKLELRLFPRNKTKFAFQKFPGLSLYEIRQNITKLKKELNINFDFSVTQDKPGMFVIRKKTV